MRWRASAWPWAAARCRRAWPAPRRTPYPAEAVSQAEREFRIGIALGGGLAQPRKRGGFILRRAVAIKVTDRQAELRRGKSLLRRPAETKIGLAKLVLPKIHHAQIREPAYVHRPAGVRGRQRNSGNVTMMGWGTRGGWTTLEGGLTVSLAKGGGAESSEAEWAPV